MEGGTENLATPSHADIVDLGTTSVGTGRQMQTDPALDQAGAIGQHGSILSARILALIEDSGASLVQIYSALNAAKEIAGTLAISLVHEAGNHD